MQHNARRNDNLLQDFGADRGLIAMCSTRRAQTEAGQEGSVGVSNGYD